MSTSLIYMSGFGPTHASMCNTLVKSLRVFGEYSGDILVFTDIPDIFDKDTRLHVKNIPGLTTRHERGNLRLKCTELFPFENYRTVMYLDADVLCVNPVQPIFDHYAKRFYTSQKFAYVRDQLPMDCKYYNVCLKDQEIPKGTLGISSAMFIVHGTKFKEYLNIWNHAHQGLEGKFRWMHDQHTLNYVLWHELIPAEELPGKWFEIPYYYKKHGQEDQFEDRIGPKNIFWHFVAFNGDHKADYCMKHHFNKLLDRERFPDIVLDKPWVIDEGVVR